MNSHRTLGRIAMVPMLVLLVLGSLSFSGSASPAAYAAPAAAPTSTLDFRNAMRKLWEDHVTWTRLYIVSALGDLPDKEATAARLLHNQEDIGNAIKPFYGDAAGDKLTALLKDHILGAAGLLAAAKAGDNTAVKAASDKWYANADEIAAFLSGANPKAWPLDVMKDAMKMHLDQTLKEAVDHLKGDYAADIADYDAVHDHILMMADALSAGITSQFPDRFSAAPSDAEVSLRTGMRKLWEDHITWTRLYIVSALGGLPDKDATAARLLRNQEDIGNAIKPLYGDAAGDKLTALLKDHILGAAGLLAAAKAGDNTAVKAASDKWYANANDIAAFLNGANPKAWPLDAMQMGMKMHLDQTLKEAVDHLKGDYAADIADYDAVHEHILGLADTLSAGIVSQFPAQFGGQSAPPVGMPTTGAAGDLPVAWQLSLTGLLLAAVGLLALRRSSRTR
jgi:hypothetical protein